MLCEAFGAVATLQQEALACGYSRKRLFQVTGLTCKNQGRKRRKLRLDIGQCLRIGIIGDLQHRSGAPAVGCPPLGHDVNSSAKTATYRKQRWRGYTQARHPPPVGIRRLGALLALVISRCASLIEDSRAGLKSTTTDGGYGFRARCCASPRNDGLVVLLWR